MRPVVAVGACCCRAFPPDAAMQAMEFAAIQGQADDEQTEQPARAIKPQHSTAGKITAVTGAAQVGQPVAAHTFAGSGSMRVNYTAGVDNYYQQHGHAYRNPHFPGILAAVHAVLHRWLTHHLPALHPELCTCLLQCPVPVGHQHADAIAPQQASHHDFVSARQELSSDRVTPLAEAAAIHYADSTAEQVDSTPIPSSTDQDTNQVARPSWPCIPGRCETYAAGPHVRVLDLACGSGEASQAFTAAWLNISMEGNLSAIQHCSPVPWSAAVKSTSLNRQHVQQQATLHSAVIASELQQPLPSCPMHPGSTQQGSSTSSGLQLRIDASDPYTGAAFQAHTGRQAESFSFQDVAEGCLLDQGRTYHMCVCSYAMHVLDTSYLFSTLQQLALICEVLLIISPHKLPKVEPHTGWKLAEHLVVERVHARLYTSTCMLNTDALLLQLRTPESSHG